MSASRLVEGKFDEYLEQIATGSSSSAPQRGAIKNAFEGIFRLQLLEFKYKVVYFKIAPSCKLLSAFSDYNSFSIVLILRVANSMFIAHSWSTP